MSRLVLVLLVLACAACGSAGPVTVEEPAPLPEVVAPAPVLSALEPPPPLPLPEAPRGSLTERRVYPGVGVTEWTLANGLRVVYKRLPNASSSFVGLGTPEGLAAPAPTGGAAPGAWGGHSRYERWAIQPDPALPASVALARAAVDGEARGALQSVTVVLVGPWPEADVENLVGHGLASLRKTAPPASPVPSAGDAGMGVTVPFRWADVPSLLVAAAGLDGRDGATVHVALDPRDGVASLEVAAPGAADLVSLLRPFAEEELARARRHALDLWGPDATAGWGRLVHALWAEPGDYRPARDPSIVGRTLADLVRVSPESVEALLARLRASARTVSPR